MSDKKKHDKPAKDLPEAGVQPETGIVPDEGHSQDADRHHKVAHRKSDK